MAHTRCTEHHYKKGIAFVHTTPPNFPIGDTLNRWNTIVKLLVVDKCVHCGHSLTKHN